MPPINLINIETSGKGAKPLVLHRARITSNGKVKVAP